MKESDEVSLGTRERREGDMMRSGVKMKERGSTHDPMNEAIHNLPILVFLTLYSLSNKSSPPRLLAPVVRIRIDLVVTSILTVKSSESFEVGSGGSRSDSN